ncbi:hypothetical protein [Flagellimonas sp.]|uniref:hypothetical protein n=1 Tax=Flagellimonas sp. TaxID=2058762 RepID=UPI003B517793
MDKRALLGLFLMIGMWYSHAQETAVGVSFQVYPAGFIPTLNFEHAVNDNTSLLFRAGANFADRKDFSDVNISEEGDGFGGTLGLRKHFPSGNGKFIAGLNLDVWSMHIDWTDMGPADGIISGSTYVLVVQPWLEGGYFLPFKKSNSEIGLTLGFGREINAITSGEEVEQGFIASISLQYLILL